MPDILIVGGGFAGVWSAAAAARVRQEASADFSITLVAPSEDLVIRPRLYEANPHEMRVPLDRILSPIQVGRVAANVIEIDTVGHVVTTHDRDGRTQELAYQRLVLASGSRVRRPDLAGGEYLHDVDTIDTAALLDRHLQQLSQGPGRLTAVVVGAGFTGLEIATELVGRLQKRAAHIGASNEVRVVLVERADAVGPDLGPGPRPAILAALTELGVEIRLQQSVASLTRDTVHFTDGTALPAQTVIWTAGISASPLTESINGQRDRLGRLYVDQFLNVPRDPHVYAAGDTAAARAEGGNLVMPSCQHAIPMGKYAGYNVAADLLGSERVAFETSPYATCLDLGAAGAVLTTGWERAIQKTGEEAKQYKRRTNRVRIYPPLDDAAEILRVASFQVTTRQIAAAE